MKNVEYTVEAKDMVGTIRSTQYRYIGKEAKYIEGGAYVDIEDISEYNLKALYDVYRKEKGIVSLEKIQAISERYAIGKGRFLFSLAGGNTPLLDIEMGIRVL